MSRTKDLWFLTKDPGLGVAHKTRQKALAELQPRRQSEFSQDVYLLGRHLCLVELSISNIINNKATEKSKETLKVRIQESHRGNLGECRLDFKAEQLLEKAEKEQLEEKQVGSLIS